MSTRFFETVEPRRLFTDVPITPPGTAVGVHLEADRALIVQGTSSDDSVAITAPDANTVRVVFNGQVSTFDRRDLAVDEVIVDLGDGNNTLTNSASFLYGLAVSSGSGDDSITTGLDPDKVVLPTADNPNEYDYGSDDVYDYGGNNTIRTGGGDDEVEVNAGGNEPGPGGSNTVDLGTGTGRIGSADGKAGDVLTVTGDAEDAQAIVEVDVTDGTSVHATISGHYASVTTGSGDDVIDLSDATASTITGTHIVSTGPGNDSIVGTAGDDSILPGSGNDTVRSGAGNDLVGYLKKSKSGQTLFDPAESDDDVYDLGTGNDLLTDAAGDNRVDAGDGNDTVRTGDGNDTVNGGLGRDLVYTAGGNDSIDGGGSIDRLFGQDGDDVIRGGNNSDVIVGGLGNDTLIGNAGNDLLIAGNPNAARVQSAINHFDGGTGTDRYQLESDADVLASLETPVDTVA